ncbi:MAG: gamma carbonic anhydrase family protein [Mycobacterium sp.]
MIIEVGGREPKIDATTWIAPNAAVIGDVRLGAEVGVFYGASVRADLERITVGTGTNIQDGVVLHADPGYPLTIGRNVSVGHNAVLHGCTVQDDCLVGMGAVVLNGATLDAGSLVAALVENANSYRRLLTVHQNGHVRVR